MLSDIKPAQVVSECTGLVFRFKRNIFTTKSGFRRTEELSLLKRKSCKCPKCSGILDCLREDVDCEHEPDLSKLINGKAYNMCVTVTSRDFETGYPDDWEYRFVEYVEK